VAHATLYRIRKKLFKYLARIVPTNGQRIWCLRRCGYEIGSAVYIGDSFIVTDTLEYRGGLVIGDEVAIAPRVTVIAVSGPTDNSRLIALVGAKSGPVRIESDCWIGAGVIILPGVTIHECSIVGAGAVVTADIPPFSIAVGVPARVIGNVNDRSPANHSPI